MDVIFVFYVMITVKIILHATNGIKEQKTEIIRNKIIYNVTEMSDLEIEIVFI